MDETMAEIASKSVKVIVPRDMKNPASRTPDARGMHITVILCIAADGTHVTPTLILPLKHFPEDCIALAHRYHWSGQEEGWITEQIFRDWVIKVFIPHVQNRRQLRNLPEQPALLWLDGHSSRGSPEALQALIDANIITATIPAHTSHILQPLDCGVNRAMKQCMRTRRGRIKDDSTAGYRKSLLEATDYGIHHALYHETVTNAWNESCLFPWDPARKLGNSNQVSEAVPQATTPSKRRLSSLSGKVLTRQELVDDLIKLKAKRQNSAPPKV